MNEEDEKKLADLEEALAHSGGGSGWSGESGRGNGVRGDARAGLDTMSLNSDATTSSQTVWAGGACEGLVYESVDELRVTVDSVKVRGSAWEGQPAIYGMVSFFRYFVILQWFARLRLWNGPAGSQPVVDWRNVFSDRPQLAWSNRCEQDLAK